MYGTVNEPQQRVKLQVVVSELLTLSLSLSHSHFLYIYAHVLYAVFFFLLLLVALLREYLLARK